MCLGFVAEECLGRLRVLVNGLLLGSPFAKGHVRAAPSAEQSPVQQSGTKTKARGGKARGLGSWVSLGKTSVSSLVTQQGDLEYL